MSVSDAIGAYESVLGRSGEVVDFDISALDRLGVPVTSCSLAVEGRLAHNGNGYGATPEAARLSGLGELAEGVLAGARVAELGREAVRESRQGMTAEHGADRVVDPRTLCLPAGSAYTEETPYAWVPVTRVRTGETCWVPLDFVANEAGDLSSGDPLIPPVSNGLGAGLDRDRAVGHGVLEILQRHTNGLRFRALDRVSPVIEPTDLPDSVRLLVETFRACGVQPVLKHAATQFGVSSTYAMGLDKHPDAPIMLAGCGEAAHPDVEVSLTKALLEYANSRVRKTFSFGDPDRARTVAPPAYWHQSHEGPGERRAVQALRAWADLSLEALRTLTAPDQARSVRLSEVAVSNPPALGSPAELLSYLLGQLSDHDVLACLSEIEGVVVAKTVVTGLEVETLSYGRIGELGVRTAIELDLDLVRVAAEPSGEHRARVCLTENAEERLGGPAWYSYATADRLVGPLYPLYREPPRHSVQV